MLETLTFAAFFAQIGTICHLDAAPAGQPIELRIVEVVAHGEPPSGRRTPFSVFFLGPGGPPMPQRTYALEHSVFGRLEIFIVPLGPRGSDGQTYEAVFS